MLNSSLWFVGLSTMLVGMGVVFTFLVILVFAIHIMVKIVAYINKVCPLPIEEPKTKKIAKSADDGEIALAVALAMSQKI